MRALLVIAATAAVIAATPGLAQNRIGFDRTLHVRTTAGKTVRVSTFARWTSRCEASTPPDVVVRTQPQNGRLTIEPGISHITVLAGDAADCTGRDFPGTAVLYTPQAGFTGSDTFDFDVVGGNTRRHDTVVVDVR